jgi:hypothetical protein
MFLVSDMRNGGYKISGMFIGANAKEKAIAWAGGVSKVTRLRSQAIWATLQTGQTLPKRYA